MRISLPSLLCLSSALLLAPLACQKPADKSAADDKQEKPAPEEAKPEAKKAESEKAPKKVSGKVLKIGNFELDPLPEGPIATIDGEPIDREAFEALYVSQLTTIAKRRDKGDVPPKTQRYYRRNLSSRLVWEALLAKEAKTSGVDADPKELGDYETEIKKHKKKRAEGLRSTGESEQSDHLRNVAFFREKAMLKSRRRMEATEEELKEAYEKDVPLHVLLSKEERVRAAHFLLAIGPREGDEKIYPASKEEREAASPETIAKWEADSLARAKELRAIATKPGAEEFIELAKKLSEGPGASRGGDMGVFPRNRMIKAYADAAFTMKIGEISEPFKTERGYFVVKLLDRIPANQPISFETMRAELKRNAEGQIFREAKNDLQVELYEKYKVHFNLQEALDEPAPDVLTREKLEAIKKKNEESLAQRRAKIAESKKQGAEASADPGKPAAKPEDGKPATKPEDGKPATKPEGDTPENKPGKAPVPAPSGNDTGQSSGKIPRPTGPKTLRRQAGSPRREKGPARRLTKRGRSPLNLRKAHAVEFFRRGPFHLEKPSVSPFGRARAGDRDRGRSPRLGPAGAPEAPLRPPARRATLRALRVRSPRVPHRPTTRGRDNEARSAAPPESPPPPPCAIFSPLPRPEGEPLPGARRSSGPSS